MDLISSKWTVRVKLNTTGRMKEVEDFSTSFFFSQKNEKSRGGFYMAQLAGLYLETTKVHERLNNEELFKLRATADDEERNRIEESIILNNIPMVHKIIKNRYPNLQELCRQYRVTSDEIFSNGYFGLIKAVNLFDLEKGYKFVTYASMAINNELSMFIRGHKKFYGQDSLDEVVLESDNHNNDVTRKDLLFDPTDAYSVVDDELFSHEVMVRLIEVVPDKHLEIFTRYLQGVHQREIAKEFNYSQSYISRLVNKVIDKAKLVALTPE